jgi:hypothetical protein
MGAGATQRSLFDVPVPGATGPNCYDLEPLHRDGPDSITPLGIPGLLGTALRELHSISDNLECEVIIRIAADLFDHGSAADDYNDLFAPADTMTVAVFDFYFVGSPTPRVVTIRPPYRLELERSSDAEIVQRWASLHGFLVSLGSSGGPHEQAMAIP